MITWVCALLALERLDRFCSNSIFESLFIIGRYPMNINILAPEIVAIQMAPNSGTAFFLKSGSNDLDCISAANGDHLRKQNCISGILRKVTVRAWGA
jgi:hypothetical protein